MKTERLLTIIMILLDKKQISASKLADMLEVSVRTIYRDVTSLSEAGVPITTIPGVNGGIQIMDNYKIDKHFFTTTDITSLLIALESLATNVSPIQLNQILEKVKTLVPTHYLEEIEFKTNQIAIDLTPWTSSKTVQPFLELIKIGLDRSRLLTFHYENNQGILSQRKVEPYRLVLKEISWYLQAYCLEKQDFRTFKLSRITDLMVLNEEFSPQPFIPLPLGRTPWIQRDFTTIRLKIKRRLKDQLIDKFGELTFTEHSDPAFLLVDFSFMEDEYGYNLLLGFGNNCECLAPEHVREELGRRIMELAVVYQK
ncbi:WYL domain-containing protein [Erwinia sp. CPCC 100877]|nr:WYL domain-containing protein [Erwinia sp. CPCC 100877]